MAMTEIDLSRLEDQLRDAQVRTAALSRKVGSWQPPDWGEFSRLISEVRRLRGVVQGIHRWEG